jgi:hypothetical protein
MYRTSCWAYLVDPGARQSSNRGPIGGAGATVESTVPFERGEGQTRIACTYRTTRRPAAEAYAAVRDERNALLGFCRAMMSAP